MTTSPAAPDAPAQLEASIEIDAPPAAVWALVSDPRRMAAWSPQVVRSFVRGGPTALGTTFVNINHRGLLHWPTQAKVVRFTPESDFAWRIKENRTIWSFTLAPTATGGTTLTQRRETPQGISTLSNRMVGIAMGGITTFVGELDAGMHQTLERIKADAEG